MAECGLYYGHMKNIMAECGTLCHMHNMIAEYKLITYTDLYFTRSIIHALKIVKFVKLN